MIDLKDVQTSENWSPYTFYLPIGSECIFLESPIFCINLISISERKYFIIDCRYRGYRMSKRSKRQRYKQCLALCIRYILGNNNHQLQNQNIF